MEVMEKENKHKKSFPTRSVGALAMVMICICGFFVFNQYNENSTIDSIVEFNVNPSIELQLNKKEKIIEVLALNEDGLKVIQDMDLKNTDLNVAVNAIVGSMLKNGYISNNTNSILVSVKNDDIEKATKLQEELSKEIDGVLNINSVNGSILTQIYSDNDKNTKLAEENNISVGKAELVNKVIKAELKDYNNNTITSEALSKMSINELNLLLKEKDTKVEAVKTTGIASENSYIGREKAKQIAFANAKTTASEAIKIQVELDYDNGTVVYEVNFSVDNTEYEYEINAKTGNIINFETDHDNYYRPTSSSISTKVTTNNTSSYISREKAKQIAFNHANVSSNNATRVEIELDNGEYEVQFSVGNIEYDYEINAKTGTVIKAEKDYDD